MILKSFAPVFSLAMVVACSSSTTSKPVPQPSVSATTPNLKTVPKPNKAQGKDNRSNNHANAKSISVTLQIVTRTERISPSEDKTPSARLEFANNNEGEDAFSLTRFITGEDGKITNNLFVIEGPDGRVPYTGRLAKRGPPGADGFRSLKPGEMISGSVELGNFYKFTKIPTEYTAYYESFNHFSKDAVVLRSNRVTFTWPPQPTN